MSIVLDGTLGITSPLETVVGQFSSASTMGFKNRIINGAMGISQRGTSGTVSGAYMLDRWYANQSGTAPAWSQLYGSLFAPQRYGLQLTGAAGNTATQINQRIESINSADLANGVVTVSGWFYQNTGSTMTLPFQIFYATVGVDNYTSAIASITAVNVSLPNNVWTYLSNQITLPSVASQGIQLAITPTALGTSQIFVMSNVQLEKGSIATSFDYRPYGTELQLCQRYYQSYSAGFVIDTGSAFQTFPLPVTMRAVPTLSGTAVGAGYNISNNTTTSLAQYQTTRAQGSGFLTAEL